MYAEEIPISENAIKWGAVKEMDNAKKQDTDILMMITDAARKELSRQVLLAVIRDIEVPIAKLVFYPRRRYGWDDEAMDIIKDHLREHFPEVHDSLIDDYQLRNASAIPLTEIFGPLEWPQSENDPNSLLVSAPGFSIDGLHAMVSVGTHTNHLGASGGAYIYRKDSSGWTKLTQVMSWIA